MNFASCHSPGCHAEKQREAGREEQQARQEAPRQRGRAGRRMGAKQGATSSSHQGRAWGGVDKTPAQRKSQRGVQPWNLTLQACAQWAGMEAQLQRPGSLRWGP